MAIEILPANAAKQLAGAWHMARGFRQGRRRINFDQFQGSAARWRRWRQEKSGKFTAFP